MYSDHKHWSVMRRSKERPRGPQFQSTGYYQLIEFITDAGDDYGMAVKRFKRLVEADPDHEYLFVPFDVAITILNSGRDPQFNNDKERRQELQTLLYREAEAIRIFLARCKREGVDPFKAAYPYAKIMRDIFGGKEQEVID